MTNKTEVATMLIKFYNMQAGTALRSSNEWNQKVVLEALDRANDDITVIKNHIRTWVAENPEASKASYCLQNCFESFRGIPKTEPTPAPQVTDAQVQYSMGMLEQAVIQLISKTQSEKIESEIMSQVEDKIRNFIKDEYGTIERKITTIIDGKKAELQGVQHEKFETVLKFVANNEPVYLSGPAGSGKNVICKQVAQALGLNFYFTNAVTQEYKLTGFTDAMGNYQPTQFYKAFTEGGLFMLDEMDASIPEVLVILNAAIANRYFDFPAPIGFKEAHPNFRVIAAGNTTGHGADYEYVGRNQLDQASLDRFAFINIDYSEVIENNVAEGDTELADFCRDFRRSAKQAGLSITVSYRAIGRLAKMLHLLTIEEALQTCLVKGIDKDDANMIKSNMTDTSKYTRALARVIRAM